MTSHQDANRSPDQMDESDKIDGVRDQAAPDADEQNLGAQGDEVSQPDAAELVQQLQAELAEMKDMLLRTHAEVENVRRRSQEDVSKTRKFAIESFAESLVPVRDSLEAALALEGQSLEAMREGIETTLKQLNSAFERNHLKEIMPVAGDRFDPHLHQAIATVPAEQPSKTVVTVLQKGYLITDRVLRPALVTVAS